VPNFLKNNWQSLNWSDWISLDASAPEFRRVPTSPGFYRVRVRGKPVLAYIGQTGRNLRQRLNELRRPLFGSDTEMPWNDPHTAAPSLWAWRIAENMSFECSAAAAEMDEQMRQGFEDFLLWQYRLEQGESTLCNHGHFHRLYTKSSNRIVGRRGVRLANSELSIVVGHSYPPLNNIGCPGEPKWMGLTWKFIDLRESIHMRSVPNSPGVYKILDRNTGKLLYIGESSKLQNRLAAHARKTWKPFIPVVGIHLLDGAIPVVQRHEIETDLLGAYFASCKTPPLFQYIRHEAALRKLG
jgi:hypothetical protein